jgi:hypothetical protein
MELDADHRRFDYLHSLIGPPSVDDEQARSGPSAGVPPRLRQIYVALLCRVEPASVIPSLRYLPAEFLEWDEALRTCEDEGVFDAVVWAHDWRGSPKAALEKVRSFGTRLSATVGGLVAQGAAVCKQEQDLERHLESLEAIGRTGVAICVERSSKQVEATAEDVPVEDLWFQLLQTQISTVQAVSVCCAPDTPSSYVNVNGDTDPPPPPTQRALSRLRSLVQATFSSLVSASAARGRGRGVSFPRLFTRLVEQTTTTTTGAKSGGTPYTEFRAILTGMMEAYRAEGDMLAITKHLLDRDVFETVEMAARARARGWAPSVGTCAGCRMPLIPVAKQPGAGAGAGGAGGSGTKTRSKGKGKGAARGAVEAVEDDGDEQLRKITIMRTGIAYHGSCLAP